MLQKSDGASTYAARDCAEAIDRWERYQFGANLYVVSRQEDHFAQVFAALGKLAVAEQWPVNWPARCENISFGYVRGMSTRKGEAVWLEAVLDEARDRAGRFRVQRAEASARGATGLAAGEADAVSEAVGQAALLYFDVSSRRMTDLSFDWDAVLQFEGNTGPYLQYAHARMSGIFRKAAELGLVTIDEPGDLAALRCRRGVAAGAEAARLFSVPCVAQQNSVNPSRSPTTSTNSPACSMPFTTSTWCSMWPSRCAVVPGSRW